MTRARRTAPEPISVLLVDDHTLVRNGLRRLLEDDPGIIVVGEAGDGDSAVRLAHALAPQVIVMEYVLPGRSGLATIRRLRGMLPDVAVLMLSIRNEAPLVRRALAAGARGYIAKRAMDVDLAQAVRRAAAGEIVVTQPVSAPTTSNAACRLTTGELEVLTLICRGLTTPAIAAELGWSVNTVRVHRANIMRALDVHRTTALVAYAARHGLVDVRQA